MLHVFLETTRGRHHTQPKPVGVVRFFSLSFQVSFIAHPLAIINDCSLFPIVIHSKVSYKLASVWSSSVLTLNCRYIIYSLVLPRFTLVRLILEITCELNIPQDTLCRWKHRTYPIIAPGRSPCAVFVLLGYCLLRALVYVRTAVSLLTHYLMVFVIVCHPCFHGSPYHPSQTCLVVMLLDWAKLHAIAHMFRAHNWLSAPDLSLRRVCIAIAGHAVGHIQLEFPGLANPRRVLLGRMCRLLQGSWGAGMFYKLYDGSPNMSLCADDSDGWASLTAITFSALNSALEHFPLVCVKYTE